jgi:hypothetical protein
VSSSFTAAKSVRTRESFRKKVMTSVSIAIRGIAKPAMTRKTLQTTSTAPGRPTATLAMTPRV